VNWLGFTAIET